MSVTNECVQTENKYNQLHPFHARLKTNTRVTSPDHFQDVRHMVLDTAGSGIMYVNVEKISIFSIFLNDESPRWEF